MATADVSNANKDLVNREVREVWTEDNLEVIDDLYAPDVKIGTRRMGEPQKLATREDIKAIHREWDEGFPNATFTTNAMAAEDDVVFLWWTMRATHTGQFRGFKPTENPVEVDGFSFRRIEDGKVVEAKDSASMTTLLRQIGVELPTE
ncbi:MULTISPECIES: ester cyclase [unclassified Haladaptatus]|uniref:ester cyclase n=1 Tax=unclassified Haladaptatus TaxID=2622732 RepID=UPI0023E8542F|nr:MULTISPECIES: ester cyclase [unclassified Haladaptatus]